MGAQPNPAVLTPQDPPRRTPRPSTESSMTRFNPLAMCAAWLAGLAFAALSLAAAPEQDRAGAAFFESKIRPALVQHCYQCHSAEAQKNKKLRGGLLLDTREGLRKGGDSGPVVVAGKSGQ